MNSHSDTDTALRRKNYGLVQGTALCLVVISAGAALQTAFGDVDWGLLSRPWNIILLAMYLIGIGGLYALCQKRQWISNLTSYGTAIPAIASAVVVTVVLGLTEQNPHGRHFWNRMLSFWPFVMSYLWMTTILGLTCVKHIFAYRRPRPCFLLNHLGLFIVLVCSALGSADVSTLTLSARPGQAEWQALDGENKVVNLPFSIRPNGRSEKPEDGYPNPAIGITIESQSRSEQTVSVNHPASIDGWDIYLTGFSDETGNVEFTLISDPWLPAVYCGLFMMVAGALCMMFTRQQR